MHGYVTIHLKKRAPYMIRNHPNQTEFIDFIHPFGGKLPTSNRWIQLSQLVPWDTVQTLYSKSFPVTKMGAPALSGRIAFGALIIKERLNCTDEETVSQIQENPFLQYFLGLTSMKKIHCLILL